VAVDDGHFLRNRAPAAVEQRVHIGRAGQELQDPACELWQEALLAQPQPHHRRTFQCPARRGPARRQGQRHRQRGKARSQRRERLAQQVQSAPAHQPHPEHGVKQCDCERAVGQPHAIVAEQGGLQREGDERSAEHQGAVDEAVARRTVRFACTAQGVEHGDADIEAEEQDQERFDRGEVRGW
jgi:hypothetical protein